MPVPRGSQRWQVAVPENANPLLREFLEFLPEIVNESDRGMVLASTAYLDGQLGAVLRAFCVSKRAADDLIDDYKPLSESIARTRAAYALGLISVGEKLDLETLIDIRNLFAHQVHVDFTQKTVIVKCRSLKLGPKKVTGDDLPAHEHFTSTVIRLAFALAKRRQQAAAAARKAPAELILE